jgi:hypothetical protein
MHRPRRKRLFYLFLGLLTLSGLGIWGGVQYAKRQFFRSSPNTLSIVGELHPVPFEWVSNGGPDGEPHGAIIIPVTVPGVANKFYMQFDTGAPSTFFRSGCIESLGDVGVDFELYEEDDRTRVRRFELDVAGNQVVLNGGRIFSRNISIDWDNPKAVNVIGTIGADFLEQKICAIDFAAQELRLYQERPAELNELGQFAPFTFRGRRIMLPAEINGVSLEVFYDSGCSPFGLFTSKYHFDRYAVPDAVEIRFGANRFGDTVLVRHKPCALTVRFGNVELPLKRVSYVEQYVAAQSLFGRFINGGFLGNKCLTESTLNLDTKASEFLVVAGPL